MAATRKPDEALARENEALRAEMAALRAELAWAREQQAATAEILGTIAASPSEARRALDAIASATARLFSAAGATIRTLHGDRLRIAGSSGLAGDYLLAAVGEEYPATPDRLPGATVVEKRQIHIPDIKDPGPGRENWPGWGPQLAAGIRTVVGTPLMRGVEAIGALMVQRAELKPFTGEELAQLRNFADQAVIAIENARLLAELRESLEYQTATSEVLKAISRSTFEVEPVLQTMVETAARLCKAASGGVFRKDPDGMFRFVAGYSLMPEYIAHEESTPIAPGRGSVIGRAALAGKTVQILDAFTDDEYDDVQKAAARLSGIRSMIGVPLMRDGEMIGAFGMARAEVQPFTPRQIDLVTTFADQAVIAIENARLLAELRDSLERQTATSEVLSVISSSPGELGPVFETILENATRICEAQTGLLHRFDGEAMELMAGRGTAMRYADQMKRLKPLPEFSYGRMIQKREVVHVHDMAAMPEYVERTNPAAVASVDIHGAHTCLFVPMLKEDQLVGSLVFHRKDVRPFTDKQIELVESFADQAVIAIENARLLTELRGSLERQTAMSDVLSIISTSPGELGPVFETMLERAVAICEAQCGLIYRVRESAMQVMAEWNIPPAYSEYRRTHPHSGGGALGQMLTTLAPFHVPDSVDSEGYRRGNPDSVAAVELAGARTVIYVPMLNDGAIVGFIALFRKEPRSFDELHISLLQGFADQAVIAIENARLLSELRESLERRTAIAEVLQVISSSPGELQPVFETMLENAVRLCEAAGGGVLRVAEGRFIRVAARSITAHLSVPGEIAYEPGGPPMRMLEGRCTVHVPDLAAELAERPEMSTARAAYDSGVRTLVWVPMVKDGDVVAAFVLQRYEVRPFTELQIALIENFASQAVIAIENARLLAELREARDAAERNLVDLRAAQANLIQAEKMASLGQLTAGIAHEIKNPLNFVNNFAGLSVELLDELKEAQAQAVAALGADKRAAVQETIELLTGNLQKIAEHGQRADGIVKSMLAHSRGGSGERQEVDLNALVDEALNLAFHGARAQDASFNVALERDFDRALGPIEVVPQDLTRVFLNLFGNGFYAAHKKRRAGAGPDYAPTVRVATRDAGAAVEIRIRDNGTGIAPEIRDKLFEPFFTTKPTGEGTGLGLSISYEIVTRQHGGAIAVASEPGEFTEFAITLPKRFGAGAAG